MKRPFSFIILLILLQNINCTMFHHCANDYDCWRSFPSSINSRCIDNHCKIIEQSQFKIVRLPPIQLSKPIDQRLLVCKKECKTTTDCLLPKQETCFSGCCYSDPYKAIQLLLDHRILPINYGDVTCVTDHHCTVHFGKYSYCTVPFSECRCWDQYEYDPHTLRCVPIKSTNKEHFISNGIIPYLQTKPHPNPNSINSHKKNDYFYFISLLLTLSIILFFICIVKHIQGLVCRYCCLRIRRTQPRPTISRMVYNQSTNSSLVNYHLNRRQEMDMFDENNDKPPSYSEALSCASAVFLEPISYSEYMKQINRPSLNNGSMTAHESIITSNNCKEKEIIRNQLKNCPESTV